MLLSVAAGRGGSEAVPVGDHHAAAADGGRGGGAAQTAARGLPAQLLAPAAAEEHCQGLIPLSMFLPSLWSISDLMFMFMLKIDSIIDETERLNWVIFQTTIQQKPVNVCRVCPIENYPLLTLFY